MILHERRAQVDRRQQVSAICGGMVERRVNIERRMFDLPDLGKTAARTRAVFSDYFPTGLLIRHGF